MGYSSDYESSSESSKDSKPPKPESSESGEEDLTDSSDTNQNEISARSTPVPRAIAKRTPITTRHQAALVSPQPKSAQNSGLLAPKRSSRLSSSVPSTPPASRRGAKKRPQTETVNEQPVTTPENKEPEINKKEYLEFLKWKELNEKQHQTDMISYERDLINRQQEVGSLHSDLEIRQLQMAVDTSTGHTKLLMQRVEQYQEIQQQWKHLAQQQWALLNEKIDRLYEIIRRVQIDQKSS